MGVSGNVGILFEEKYAYFLHNILGEWDLSGKTCLCKIPFKDDHKFLNGSAMHRT